MNILYIFFAAAPAVLLVVGAARWLSQQSDRRKQIRLSLALVFLGILIAAVSLVFQQGVTILLLFALAPAALGVLALGFSWVWRAGKTRGWLVLGLVVLAVLAAVLTNSSISQVAVLGWIAGGTLVLACAWLALGHRWSRLAALSLAVLGLLRIHFPDLLSGDFNLLPGVLQTAVKTMAGIINFLLPGWVVSLAAVLGLDSLRLMRPQPGSDQSLTTRPDWRGAVLTAALALGLLGWLAVEIYWASAWDQTNDGLGGIFYWMLCSVVALGAGVFLGLQNQPMPTRVRWAYATAFSVFVPGLLFLAFRLGWNFDYHAATEQRAGKIALALEAYRDRQGSYPQALEALSFQDLAPQRLWTVPQQFILRGETWCYQGWQDGYRLGALYRQYFSTPLEVRVYATQGADPPGEWDCPQRLADFVQRYGAFGP